MTLPSPLAHARRLARVARATGLVPYGLTPGLLRVPGLLLSRGLDAAMLPTLHARLHPAGTWLVDASGSLSWAEADEAIDRCAQGLSAELGLARGEGVVLALENRAEYLLAWFACLRLGARALHAGSHLTPDELTHVCERGRARILVTSPQGLEAARVVAPDRGLRVVTCGAEARGGEVDWAGLLGRARVGPAGRLAPGAESVVFTSGTTGRAKGAVRDLATYGPLEFARVLERLPLEAADRHLLAGPLYHSMPQAFALVTSALGGTLYLAPRFDAAAVNQTLAREGIHTVSLVPTMLRRLLELPAPPAPSVRAVVVGSSEFPEPLRRAALARFGVQRVFDFYGATELGWVTLIRGDEMLAHPGSVGRPLSGVDLEVVDEAGRRCPPGQPGTIRVRHAQPMLGYAQDAAATGEVQRDGWWTVQDLGFLDAGGFLHLSGRARDLVKSGGVNVYPAEVERVLAEDPSVREVAVIGVPDPEWGERVLAVVALHAGHPFEPEALAERARRRLSGARVPRLWRQVDALPRNANGKVLKTELRARFAPGG